MHMNGMNSVLFDEKLNVLSKTGVNSEPKLSKMENVK